MLLCVGRITARKGLAVFARDILPAIVERRPDARLLVIGDEPVGALQHRSGEAARVQEALSAAGLVDRTLFLRDADDETLDAAYFAADALVFPVQDRPGDHEGFGMVAVEAAAHGLPTIAFAAGGVSDAVRDGVSGRLVPPGDNAAFAAAVLDTLDQPPDPKGARGFAEQFAWALFAVKLRQLASDA
ncbi:glycosyltransferase [Acidihalobacter ferrooxydans]|uniref:glycosyltransferase n=1 Tax=Acidihalobacter ferrooxydans TaxID=1765967 RepID=UPI001E62A52E